MVINSNNYMNEIITDIKALQRRNIIKPTKL